MVTRDVIEYSSVSPLRAPRRWPVVLAILALAIALALTGALFVRDRENAAAASSSRANTVRDKIAYASLARLSSSMLLGDSLSRSGVLGLRQFDARDLRQNVVAPLGGTLTTSPGGWTLALGGGWSCLTWIHVEVHWIVPDVSRGVCGQAPIQVTPIVSPTVYALAIRRDERAQRAAMDAAYVVAAFASTAQGYSPRFSLAALADRFERLGHVDFRSAITPVGVTVIADGSSACLAPTPSQQFARILPGRCPI